MNPLVDIILKTFSTCVAIYLIIYIIKIVKINLKLPRGPIGLPILGYLPFLGSSTHLDFLRLSEKYGKVFSLKLGQHYVVVLNDWQTIKEAYGKEENLGKPKEAFSQPIISSKSLVELDGAPWKAQRRFSASSLRRASVGSGETGNLEKIVRTHVRHFIANLNNQEPGKPINIKPLLSSSVSDIISTILFGSQFTDHGNKDKEILLKACEDVLQFYDLAGLMMFAPTLSRIYELFNIGNYRHLVKAIRSVQDTVSRQVDHQEESHCDDNQKHTFITGFLSEVARRRSSTTDCHLFTRKSLEANLRVIFVAGFETITTTLSWLLIYLVKFPEFQERIRSEIMDKIGPNREASMADSIEMPFTTAFIYESQRRGTVFALNLPRRALVDFTIADQTIPKDTIVFFNFYGASHDPKIWPDPYQFNPERFISPDGCRATRPPHHIPFSVKKRVCPGEKLAYMEIFAYLVSILQRYRVTVAHNVTLSEEGILGTTLRPKYLPEFIFEEIQR